MTDKLYFCVFLVNVRQCTKISHSNTLDDNLFETFLLSSSKCCYYQIYRIGDGSPQRYFRSFNNVIIQLSTIIIIKHSPFFILYQTCSSETRNNPMLHKKTNFEHKLQLRTRMKL